MGRRTHSREKRAFAEAVEKLGGQTAMADALSKALGRPVSQQWIWNVINRPQPIPPQWCIPIESATAGAITRHQLRPDLYPAPAMNDAGTASGAAA